MRIFKVHKRRLLPSFTYGTNRPRLCMYVLDGVFIYQVKFIQATQYSIPLTNSGAEQWEKWRYSVTQVNQILHPCLSCLLPFYSIRC